ncbi:MAG: proline racemase family protein [Desulfobacterales bacterium]|nr:proline racemase family protein [Desulfobacterales bacterium]
MALLNDIFSALPSPDTSITTIDSHTEGEATRLIVDGVGPVPGRTMTDKLAYFKAHYDHVRCLITKEPRGSRSILAAMVTEGMTPGASFGLIYMDAKRYPYLCGHATMGAVTTLSKTGFLNLGEGKNQVLVDTPSGVMDACAEVAEGEVVSVAVNMVPAFVHDTDREITVPGYGTISVDLVCTGGYFAMVDSDLLGIPPVIENRKELVDLGMKIIDAANDQLEVRHPLRPEVNTIDVTEFHTSSSGKDGHWGRGVVVYGESHMDRSPCGTGTASKLALLRHRGTLEMHQPYRNLSPLGTAFDAALVEKTDIGGKTAYVARIKGRAWITGLHHFSLDDSDPFTQGYIV